MGDKVLAVSIVYLTCHFAFNVILSAFAGATEGVIFKHRIGQISANHTIQVTPSGPTFMIWNFIYLWLLAAYLYLTANIFRSTGEASGKRYCSPPIFGRWVTWVLILNAFFYTAWLFIWDNQWMTAAASFLTLIAISNWVALIIFSVSLWNNVVILKTEAPIDLILHRVLIQNGFGMYTTWTTIASLINIAVALVYDGKLEDPVPSLIALAFLSVLIALWVPLEFFFWDNYFRYLLTPLFVVLWALSGIHVEQTRNVELISESVRDYTLILMIITGILIIGKIILTIYRHVKRPLYIGLSTVA
ncbi:unnamed protein product [Orchesella dallaii]|uniref:Uncharacterized protein n=1 Tax=Orchesella dallaii TaxID=48710 RepID=A0ABP1Q3W7_9HEXA